MRDRLRRDLIDLMLIPGLSGHEERVAAAVDESAELRDALRNPAVTKSQRRKVIDALGVVLVAGDRESLETLKDAGMEVE